ncbi:F0F1 ATP synthase subunit alpha [Anaeropeptidivorans aminofermentans]|uniref:F0F1 ATP synthase subunit alpha n=1 Tax=Anaeropeptidivorans aminofermentans TaxID=2934315 RepID=UPI0020253729|nr:F0F1 ATP synthase subunit alpha [Anaeropeptidivorans aminofermentans]
MQTNPINISSALKESILNFVSSAHINEAGRVLQVGDGIAKIYGLNSAMSGELLEFEDGTKGIALNLEEDSIGVVILGDDTNIREGNLVTRTGKIAQVPVGDSLLGRIVDPLGNPLDQKGNIKADKYRTVERVAPGVLSRHKVDVPLQTGIKAIDSMVPIGKGQRQLIIGDRQTGKTSIAIDTIINQKDKDVYCVYVAIGQKRSNVVNIVSILTEHDAMKYTTIVMAGASDSASLQYLSPYSGCAIAEEWMENGKDVLIVYDDLSKHAVAYRTMSLLLRRPPGREAYPGDVFYLHSRLLERAGRLSKEYGGGSITALPIIETYAGDMSAYIPTNVISITDGQIYLETEAFNSGIRPAINPGLSVSRVGGSAQRPAMKKIAGPLRMELAQYRELEAFAQFSSDLDKDTRRRLRHGERIVEVLKQPQYSPYTLAEELLVFFAVTKYCLLDINVEDITGFVAYLIGYFKDWHQNIMDTLMKGEIISEGLSKEMLEIIEACKKSYLA